MIVRYKIGNAWVEVEADTIQEIFKKLMSAREVFSITTCGVCGKEDIFPNYRKAQTYDFYEMRC